MSVFAFILCALASIVCALVGFVCFVAALGRRFTLGIMASPPLEFSWAVFLFAAAFFLAVFAGHLLP